MQQLAGVRYGLVSGVLLLIGVALGFVAINRTKRSIYGQIVLVAPQEMQVSRLVVCARAKRPDSRRCAYFWADTLR